MILVRVEVERNLSSATVRRVDKIEKEKPSDKGRFFYVTSSQKNEAV
jgi:hypothetical protein